MDTVYIGIDPTAGSRPIDYVVIDGGLHLVARGLGKLDQVLEVVRSYPSAVVAVDAPQSPNAGLMADPARRESYGLPTNTKTWADFQVCEDEPRRRRGRAQVDAVGVPIVRGPQSRRLQNLSAFLRRAPASARSPPARLLRRPARPYPLSEGLARRAHATAVGALQRRPRRPRPDGLLRGNHAPSSAGRHAHPSRPSHARRAR